MKEETTGCVMKNKSKFGDVVEFELDGNPLHKGTGVVKVINSRTYEVELLTPCKEFDAGVMLIVDHSEINQALEK